MFLVQVVSTVDWKFSAKWQATQCRGSISLRTGVSRAQRSAANGHRVRNRQPDGGDSGLGGSPKIGGRWRRRRGLATGAAARSARVYGCRGRSYSAAVGALSTITPRYITATSFEM